MLPTFAELVKKFNTRQIKVHHVIHQARISFHFCITISCFIIGLHCSCTLTLLGLLLYNFVLQAFIVRVTFIAAQMLVNLLRFHFVLQIQNNSAI